MERSESGLLAHQRFEQSSLAARNTLARLRSDSVATGQLQPKRAVSPPASEWFDASALSRSRRYSRTESRWEFRFLGALAVRTRSIEAYSDEAGHVRLPRDAAPVVALPSGQRSRSPSRHAIAALVVMLTGAATMGLALPSGTGAKPGSVEVMLPPAPQQAARSPEMASPRQPVEPGTRKVTPADKQPAIAPVADHQAKSSTDAAPQAALAYSLDLEPLDATPLEQRLAVRTAMLRAFRSDEVQPWSDRGVEGVVVVGPAEQLAGRTCRDVAILARGGAGSETANARKCLTDGGGLVAP